MQNYPTKFEPKGYQRLAVERFCNKKYFALFSDMGTGKTKISLDISTVKFMYKEIECLIVIGPKQPLNNWEEIEIPKHLSIPYDMCRFRAPMTDKRTREIVSTYKSPNDRLKIFLINIEAINIRDGAICLNSFLNKFKCMVVVDESTIIKNEKARCTQKLTELCRKAEVRCILSGYPAPKNAVDYYSQAEFLNEGLSRFRSMFSFRNFYCTTIKRRLRDELVDGRMRPGRQFIQVTGARNEKHLIDWLDSFSLRLKKEDCLDLPDKQFIPEIVEPTYEQRLAYTQMKNRLIVELESGELATATVAVARNLKLHQIACGCLHSDDDVWTRISQERIDVVRRIADSTDDKIVIWAHYKDNIEYLQRELGSEAMSDYNSMADLEQWRTGDKRFLILNPASSARGLTLTESATNILYSYSYNLEHWLQLQDRTHRIGQTRKVNYHVIQTALPIEKAILHCLEQKKNFGDYILNNLRNILK